MADTLTFSLIQSDLKWEDKKANLQVFERSITNLGRSDLIILPEMFPTGFTMKAEDMSEYTVRWPGHIQRYIDERDAGKLDLDALLDSWTLDKTRDEFTWMEVKAENDAQRFIWRIEDSGHKGDSSMARTTGLVTLATALTLCENDEILPSGVFSPEELPPAFLDRALSLMVKNGVKIEHHIERSN